LYLLAVEMKKLIVTAATAIEIEPFVRYLESNYQSLSPHVFQNKDYQIHITISGVGMMSTAYSMATHFAQQDFDAAMQVGIAGAFDTELKLGSLVAVISEQYGDLGAEDNGRFIDIFELGFIEKDIYPFEKGKLNNSKPWLIGEALPNVSSLSVNSVSGEDETIEARKKHFDCQIESMEGIAFHYACLRQQIPFVQIRSISNYVTPRNKAEWKIKLAIDNLNQYLIETFSTN
jgi:futalosine hydrolase